MPIQTEKMYRYPLRCGHVYASTTRSLCAGCDAWLSDDAVSTHMDMYHWFTCARCPIVTEYTHDEALEIEQRPARIDGKRITDSQVAIVVDGALVRERVRRSLQLWAGTLPADVIARYCGVSYKTVQRVLKSDPALLVYMRHTVD